MDIDYTKLTETELINLLDENRQCRPSVCEAIVQELRARRQMERSKKRDKK